MATVRPTGTDTRQAPLTGAQTAANAATVGQTAPEGRVLDHPIDPNAELNSQAANQETNGAGAGVQGQNVGSGFTNMQNVLQANLPGAKTMAAKAFTDSTKLNPGAAPGQSSGLGNQSQDDVNNARSQYDSGLKSFSGIQGVLNNEYSGNSYTAGQSGLDSFLTGAAGGELLNHAGEAYGKYAQNLEQLPKANAQPTMPAKPAAAPVATPLPTSATPSQIVNTQVQNAVAPNPNTAPTEQTSNYAAIQSVLQQAQAQPNNPQVQAAKTAVLQDATPAQAAAAKNNITSGNLTPTQTYTPVVSPYQPSAAVNKTPAKNQKVKTSEK